MTQEEFAMKPPQTTAGYLKSEFNKRVIKNKALLAKAAKYLKSDLNFETPGYGEKMAAGQGAVNQDKIIEKEKEIHNLQEELLAAYRQIVSLQKHLTIKSDTIAQLQNKLHSKN